MRGVGFDLPLQKWFDCKIPATTIPPRFVAHMAEEQEPVEKLHSRRLYWLGGRVELGAGEREKRKIFDRFIATYEQPGDGDQNER